MHGSNYRKPHDRIVKLVVKVSFLSFPISFVLHIVDC